MGKLCSSFIGINLCVDNGDPKKLVLKICMEWKKTKNSSTLKQYIRAFKTVEREYLGFKKSPSTQKTMLAVCAMIYRRWEAKANSPVANLGSSITSA
jgi:hypothetical protein